MKNLLALIFLVSCAHHESAIQKPQWVEAIRNGEETLKVAHGSKVYYRRIAGSQHLSRESSCEQAINQAESDIKKEFPLFPKVPYSLEVLFYDQDLKDCAVTVSINSSLQQRYEELKKLQAQAQQRREELLAKTEVTEDEASELVQQKTEIATRFALTGLTKEEFEKFAKDKVSMVQGQGLCQKGLKTDVFSNHGTMQVCWRAEIVVGYCTMKDSQCWTKTP
jgi:hypothetical protein